MQRGIFSAGSAFFLWGIFPLFFYVLRDVSALQIMAHRVLWSLIFLAIVLTLRRQWRWLPALRRQPGVIRNFFVSALLLSLNWVLYIWAINNGHVIEASLGYFIIPLVNVMLGYLVLKERLRAGQWAAVALAGAGVLWLTFQAGRMPYIALVLAASFAAYGLMRKTAALGALEGLSFETMLLFPFALAFNVWLAFQSENTFINSASDSTRWLLIASGPITAIPLLLFAAGARQIPLSVLGLLQYIGPSLQLLLGIVFFHEVFSPERLIGFVLIWSALALYAAEGLLQKHR